MKKYRNIYIFQNKNHFPKYAYVYINNKNIFPSYCVYVIQMDILFSCFQIEKDIIVMPYALKNEND